LNTDVRYTGVGSGVAIALAGTLIVLCAAKTPGRISSTATGADGAALAGTRIRTHHQFISITTRRPLNTDIRHTTLGNVITIITVLTREASAEL